jgi:hypothetical protein
MCPVLGNVSTDQVIKFTRRLASHIRSLDPNHKISSGFGLPRPAAEHLRKKPEWSSGGPDWTPDSAAELQTNLTEIHQDLDIVSIHFYNGAQENERLGISGHANAALLDLIKPMADAMGKPLFIGEFGDINPFVYNTELHAEDPNALFTRSVLERIQALHIPYSAPWIWEYYRDNTYTAFNAIQKGQNFDPSYTPNINAAIKQTNVNLGNSVALPQSPDHRAPSVVLTWPLERAIMGSTQIVHAVASDDSGSVSRVEFWVDELLQASIFSAPYQFVLDTGNLTYGVHFITAKAFDAAGNEGHWMEIVQGGSQANVIPVHGDFDGDGKPDQGLWSSVYGVWNMTLSARGSQVSQWWGARGDIPVPGDYDGDGKTDFAVWRPSSDGKGTWFILKSATNQQHVPQWWGAPGDIPVPGDYDGDGITDFAVWRPSTDGRGTWYVLSYATGTSFTPQWWGAPGDIPVPGDYDGDGKTDYAVFRVTPDGEGTWYVLYSSNGRQSTPIWWGAPGDTPVPADYDGDGTTDYAVWRPSVGTWYIYTSSHGERFSQAWGLLGDIPVPGDYNHDGHADYAVWRPGSGSTIIMVNPGL